MGQVSGSLPGALVKFFKGDCKVDFEEVFVEWRVDRSKEGVVEQDSADADVVELNVEARCVELVVHVEGGIYENFFGIKKKLQGRVCVARHLEANNCRCCTFEVCCAR